MARREAIEDIMKYIDDELVICNIGFPSRELYDIKDREENFYMIGSMGLASSIGLVIDNGAYGSTGNQDTYAQEVDLVDVARGVGFRNSYNFIDVDLKEFIKSDDASFIVYTTEAGNSKAPIIDLTPVEIKNRFMDII